MDETVLRIDPSRADAFPRLPSGARTVLRLCDGTRPLTAVVALSPLPAADTQRVVERLLALGLVVAHPAAAPRRRPLAAATREWARDRPGGVNAPFTADEEAFFASGIDHLVGDEFYD